jgi:hypothetical protein
LLLFLFIFDVSLIFLFHSDKNRWVRNTKNECKLIGMIQTTKKNEQCIMNHVTSLTVNKFKVILWSWAW